MENKEKPENLCAAYSLLDEKDQEHIVGVLQALLFAKLKMNTEMDVTAPVVEGEKF